MDFSTQQRVTKNYKHELAPLDEEICELLTERINFGGDDPGIPDAKQLDNWADRYDLEVGWLHRVFHVLATMGQSQFQPIPVPSNYVPSSQ